MRTSSDRPLCHAIRSAEATLSAISVGGYQLQIVATESEIKEAKGKTIVTPRAAFTGASHRFEAETNLEPATFWNQGSRSLTAAGTKAVEEYIKISNFAEDPVGSFRIMNNKGLLSKRLNENEATTWLRGQVGAKHVGWNMTSLKNYSSGLMQNGKQAPMGTPRRPFVVVGAYALFSK